jgi:hypothetical protein
MSAHSDPFQRLVAMLTDLITLPLTNQPSISEGVGFTFLGLVKYSFRVAPLI